jgi:CDP-diacylglycerol--glycerol-3-phosphate 3-phosphatidyltransferase
MSRFLCTPVFVGIMLMHRTVFKTSGDAVKLNTLQWAALGVFFVAAVSDALDGYVAKKLNQETKLGAFLDPIADKVLLTAAILTLSLPVGLGDLRFPFWFPIIIITRDIVILLGTIIIFMLLGKVNVKPSLTGKATTFFQMSCVVGTLLNLPLQFIKYFLIPATVILTCTSCMQYVIRGLHSVNDEEKI